MYSKLPYIKYAHYYKRPLTEDIILSCYDRHGNCITGYVDYLDIKDKRPIKELLYKAWYKDTKEGKLKVSKYV